MSPNEQVVQQLFEALRRHDAAAATALYCDKATFRDIAFDLDGRDDIGVMWGIVCGPEVELKLDYGDIRTEGEAVKAHWDPVYLFGGKTKVRNPTNSTFTFCEDGKILRHVDDASRRNWASQALCFPQSLVVTLAPFVLRWMARRRLAAAKDAAALVG